MDLDAVIEVLLGNIEFDSRLRAKDLVRDEDKGESKGGQEESPSAR